jgi:hypothetical protein
MASFHRRQLSRSHDSEARRGQGRSGRSRVALDRISRLYNSLDPAVPRKELDAAADDYIAGSAEDLGGREMRLVIMPPESELARPEGQPYRRLIRNHFALRERVEHRRLRRMAGAAASAW